MKDKKSLFNLFEKLHEKKFKKIYLGHKSKPIILVAEQDGKLVGFIWGTWIKYAAFSYGMIEDLFVEKKFRNKEIGRKLVRKLKDEFKKSGTHEIFLFTEAYNKNAINLYKKLGFKKSKSIWLYCRVK